MEVVQQNVFPRWRGFHLLQMFHELPAEGRSDAEMTQAYRFRERDFQFMADFGFDFVRLPLDYRTLTKDGGLFGLMEERFALLDEAVRWGEKYGVHVDVNLHRAPGYCIVDSIPALSKGRKTEALNLWTDAEAQESFKAIWAEFARRYKGISSDALSFNMVNEPRMIPAETYTNIMKDTIGAIHAVDADRLCIIDGLNTGNSPVYEMVHMAPRHVGQACRGYIPHGVSHHKLAFLANTDDEAVWPGSLHCFENYEDPTEWNPDNLDAHYRVWAAVANAWNMGVVCSEMGCGCKTPHDVALRWLEDLLFILKKYNIGWGMWNLVGGFGILNSGRADVDYEEFRGEKLDRELLELLRKY